MKSKLIFVAGLATGYVLGTRAGRERYEQIRKGWLSVWNTEPVQNQVHKVQNIAKARVSAVPKAIFTGVSKVVKVIASDKTVGQKLDGTIHETKGAVDEIKDLASDSPSSTPSTAAQPKPAAATKPTE